MRLPGALFLAALGALAAWGPAPSSQKHAMISGGSVDVMMNPLMAQMLGRGPAPAAVPAEEDEASLPLSVKARAALASLARSARSHETVLGTALWWGPVGLLILAGVCLIVDLRAPARIMAICVSGAAGIVLIAASGAAAGAAVLNLGRTGALPGALFYAPPLWVLASAGLLKVLDPNARVWNGTLLLLGLPAAMSIAARLL